MKTLQGIIINLLVFMVLLFVTVLAFELWARVHPRSTFIEFDPLLGWRLKPGVQGVFRGQSMLHPNPYIFTPVSVNSLGLRGPERTFKKPAHTDRVLVLGDSFVQAFEIPYEETFYARLEKMAEDQRLEMIPMGVMGYGTAQELLWLREVGIKFQPDLIMLIMFLGNDITDNSRALNPNRGRPYFELQNGSLEIVAWPDIPNRLKYWVAEYIRSYLIYKELASRIQSFRSVLNRLGLDNNPLPEQKRDSNESDAKLAEAFQLTFALVKEMQRVVLGIGGKTQLLMAYYGAFPTGLAKNSDDLVEEFCGSISLECIDLNPYLVDKNNCLVPGDNHWSAVGHLLVAEALWEKWGHKVSRRIHNE